MPNDQPTSNDSSGSGRTDSGTERSKQQYQAFISIVFGVFLTSWVTQVNEVTKQECFSRESPATVSGSPEEDGHARDGKDDRRTFAPATAVILLQGFGMLLILTCLWWWYAVFLGEINPAHGFVMYLYDFLTLAAFGVAFQGWLKGFERQLVIATLFFPVSVFLGSLLMFVRFLACRLHRFDKNDTSKERKALNIALGVLTVYMLVIAGALGETLLSRKRIVEAGPTIAVIILALLTVGIGATIWSVKVTEGALTWGEPKPITPRRSSYGQ